MAMKSISPERAFNNLRRRIERSFAPNSDGCWIWTGRLGAGGYGAATLHRKGISAHRGAWLVFRGPIPEGLNVCHKCDVPACVNPDHLFLGTQRENVRDAIQKGRFRNFPAGADHWCYGRGILQAGEKSSRARLTADQVREIRASTETHVEAAKRHGITATHAQMIRERKRWRHLP